MTTGGMQFVVQLELGVLVQQHGLFDIHQELSSPNYFYRYAVGLLARNDGSDAATARDIIEREIDAQYIVPGNPWYGTYKKTFEEPIPGTAQYPASIYVSPAKHS
jgi:hypothetical protein